MAFWEHDLPYLLHPLPLQPSITRLDALLRDHIAAPMEPKALEVIHQKHVPYVLLDELLSADQKTAIVAKADAFIESWATKIEYELWQNFTRQNLRYPIISMLTIAELATALRIQGVKKVSCLESTPVPRGSLYSLHSHLPVAMWKELLPGIYSGIQIQPIESLQSRIKQAIPTEWKCNVKSMLTRAKKKLQTLLGLPHQYAHIKGALLFVMYSIDIYRNKSLIQKTKEDGRSIALCILGANSKLCRETTRKLKIPTYPSPNYAHFAKKNEYIHLAKCILKKTTFPYKSAQKLFTEFIEYSAKDILTTYQSIESVIHEFTPSVCFVSHGGVQTFRTWEKVLIDNNIPLVTIPHGAALVKPRAVFPLNKNHHFVFDNIFIKKNVQKIHPSIHSSTFDIIEMPNEYKMEHKYNVSSVKKNIILIQGTCQAAPFLAYKDGMSSRIHTLKSMLNVPIHLSDSIAIYCKSHPSKQWYEKGVYNATEIKGDIFLSPETNLQYLLEKISVAVCLNYTSSPALQAIKLNIPLVLLNTMQLSKYPRDPMQLDDILYKAGLDFVDSPEAAWEEIERLIYDREFREKRLQKQEKIVGQYLYAERADWINFVRGIAQGTPCPRP